MIGYFVLRILCVNWALEHAFVRRIIEMLMYSIWLRLCEKGDMLHGNSEVIAHFMYLAAELMVRRVR
jgi:hypothetical protein